MEPPPTMLLRIYSLIILALDLFTLMVGIWFTILMALLRTISPPKKKNIRGEVAMVIGAARGIGKEIAIQLSQLGVIVACVDINIDDCEITVQRSLKLSGVARSFFCDVTDKEQVAKTVEAVRLELGEITMLFHCCGIPSSRTLTENPPDIRQMMDVCIISHFWLLDSVLPVMKRAGKGHIVLLSSVAGLSGGTSREGRVPFSTAQFAVQGLAESLQNELRHTHANIAVSLVHVYPFVIGSEIAQDIRWRIPSYFGTMSASEAAQQILDGVRKNYEEFSVPRYLLYLGIILRTLPKKASFMLRDLLDTGVDFG